MGGRVKPGHDGGGASAARHGGRRHASISAHTFPPSSPGSTRGPNCLAAKAADGSAPSPALPTRGRVQVGDFDEAQTYPRHCRTPSPLWGGLGRGGHSHRAQGVSHTHPPYLAAQALQWPRISIVVRSVSNPVPSLQAARRASTTSSANSSTRPQLSQMAKAASP